MGTCNGLTQRGNNLCVVSDRVGHDWQQVQIPEKLAILCGGGDGDGDGAELRYVYAMQCNATMGSRRRRDSVWSQLCAAKIHAIAPSRRRHYTTVCCVSTFHRMPYSTLMVFVSYAVLLWQYGKCCFHSLTTVLDHYHSALLSILLCLNREYFVCNFV